MKMTKWLGRFQVQSSLNPYHIFLPRLVFSDLSSSSLSCTLLSLSLSLRFFLSLFFSLFLFPFFPPPRFPWKIIVWGPHDIRAPCLDFAVFKMNMTKWLGRFQVHFLSLVLSLSFSPSLSLVLSVSGENSLRLVSLFSFLLCLDPQSWSQKRQCLHPFHISTCPKMDQSSSTWIVVE